MVRIAAILVLLVPFAAACGGDEELSATAAWQLFCPSGVSNCTPGFPHFLPVDPENDPGGVAIGCDVRKEGADRRVSFEVRDDAGSIRLINALVNTSGVVVGNCTVRVEEDNNRYEGTCTSNAPTAESPCQVTLQFGPVLQASVTCNSISASSNPALLRRNVRQASAAAQPATFEFANCPGT